MDFNYLVSDERPLRLYKKTSTMCISVKPHDKGRGSWISKFTFLVKDRLPKPISPLSAFLQPSASMAFTFRTCFLNIEVLFNAFLMISNSVEPWKLSRCIIPLFFSHESPHYIMLYHSLDSFKSNTLRLQVKWFPHMPEA